MAKLYLTCKCSNKFIIETKIELNFSCPVCGKKYSYRYNPILKLYELEER